MRKLLDAMKFAAAYAKFRWFPSAASALELLKVLRPSNWKFEVDYQAVPGFEPKFGLEDAKGSYEDKKLRVRFVAGEGENKHAYMAKTMFDNSEGGDELFIDSVPMQAVSFDFDIIGLKDTLVQVELRYEDENGEFHYSRIYNQL